MLMLYSFTRRIKLFCLFILWNKRRAQRIVGVTLSTCFFFFFQENERDAKRASSSRDNENLLQRVKVIHGYCIFRLLYCLYLGAP